MGYFSNGSEGMSYESKYCDNCVHNHEEYGCPVLTMHTAYNYEECNNEESALHKWMIPRNENGFNGQCYHFAQFDEKLEQRQLAAIELTKYEAVMKTKREE